MFSKVIKKINEAKSVGIFTHINPDGDALGSAYSLKSVLNDMGKSADVFVCGKIEPCIKKLISDFEEKQYEDKYDLLVALDSADKERLGCYTDIFTKFKNTIAIDHHITHIKYAEETVVEDISSTCELIYMLYKSMNVKISVKTASYVYIGMVTDTGNFKFSSVTSNTHRTVAELIEIGVPFSDITKIIFDTMTKEYLSLQSRALNSIKYYSKGRIAVLKLTNKDFEECGLDEASATPIVSLPGKIDGVQMGVYIREREAEGYKVSLRSSKNVDVSAIASFFGGGGHIRAAGYSVECDKLDQNLKELICETEKQLI